MSGSSASGVIALTNEGLGGLDVYDTTDHTLYYHGDPATQTDVIIDFPVALEIGDSIFILYAAELGGIAGVFLLGSGDRGVPAGYNSLFGSGSSPNNFWHQGIERQVDGTEGSSVTLEFQGAPFVNVYLAVVRSGIALVGRSYLESGPGDYDYSDHYDPPVREFSWAVVAPPTPVTQSNITGTPGASQGFTVAAANLANGRVAMGVVHRYLEDGFSPAITGWTYDIGQMLRFDNVWFPNGGVVIYGSP